jgi:hypothetical protein
MDRIWARAEPRAFGRNLFGMGMKTREMGRESQPLGGALARNMHAEFPRLSPIGCSELMTLKTGMV